VVVCDRFFRISIYIRSSPGPIPEPKAHTEGMIYLQLVDRRPIVDNNVVDIDDDVIHIGWMC